MFSYDIINHEIMLVSRNIFNNLFLESKINKTWSSVSNSSFIFVLDYKFWLLLVEGNKVNSLSKLKNAIKIQDLLLNGKFHIFSTLL